MVSQIDILQEYQDAVPQIPLDLIKTYFDSWIVFNQNLVTIFDIILKFTKTATIITFHEKNYF